MNKFKVGEKVKHIPSGDIIIIKSLTKVFVRGVIKDNKHEWLCDKTTKVRISECEPYIEPPKEKSFYDKTREKNMEDAKKLPRSPEEIGQHILWLKMAVIDRIEKIENRVNNEICTFRTGKIDDPNSKFGFTERYVNLLMHYAYEEGHKRATSDLTANYHRSTTSMKNALDKIKDALDDADWINYHEEY